MNALFIDTSKEAAFVALITDVGTVNFQEWAAGPNAGKDVLGKIDRLLGESDVRLDELEVIGVNSGPGIRSSALRAGVTVAAGLALAHGAKLVIVNEEDREKLAEVVFSAVAQDVVKPNYVGTGVDSGRQER